MPTKLKLKISDNAHLRSEIDTIYESATQQQVANWSLSIATHILQLEAPEYLENEIVVNGFYINQLWQDGKARMHDVRQAGFKIHQLAKECEDEKNKIALRVVGQAVATGHMKEHGMVSSDYAIKYINLLFPDNKDAVLNERLWQIEKLKNIISNEHYAKTNIF